MSKRTTAPHHHHTLPPTALLRFCFEVVGLVWKYKFCNFREQLPDLSARSNLPTPDFMILRDSVCNNLVLIPSY